MGSHVHHTLRDGVAALTLDHAPSRNALGPDMFHAALAALQAAVDDPATRAIVLTGAGRAFSVGGDVGWFGELLSAGPDHVQAEITRTMQEAANPLVRAVAECPVPVVAAVNGPCVGGAVGLALAADVVLAARSAYFLVPQLSALGIVPDMGVTWYLPRLVGRSRALGLAMLGGRIDAAQAEQWGMVWRCVDDARLAEEADTLACQLGKLPAEAVRDTRRLMDRAPHRSLAEQLDDERVSQNAHVASPHFDAACRKFLART